MTAVQLSWGEEMIRIVSGSRMTRVGAMARTTIAIAITAALLGGCAPCSSALRPPPDTTVDVISGFHNPEDVEYVQSEDLVLVSNGIQTGGGLQLGMGRLTALATPMSESRTTTCVWPRWQGDDFKPGDLGDSQCRNDLPPECRALLAQRFSPHGIASWRTGDGVRVAVVNHRPKLSEAPAACAAAFDGRDAVELFEFETQRVLSNQRDLDHRRVDAGNEAKKAERVLVWRGCVQMPEGTRGNDLSFDPIDGGLVVANPAPHGAVSWLAGRVFRVGDLRRWTRDGGWRDVPGSKSHNPSSVVVTEKFLYFSTSSSGEVWRMPHDGTDEESEKISVCVGGLPDNLSLTSRGTLLVATHTDAGRFVRCAQSGCPSPWAVYELQPDLSQFRSIAAGDGSLLSLVSSATLLDPEGEDASDEFIFGSVTGRQIGMTKSSPLAWEARPCCR